ncbi:MAG: hypothetical protein ACI88L_000310 [Candidatus Paceibacteria bacterium]|jgi:hypothetical protein
MKSKPTQDFVPIQEIRNGIIILKDGSLRAILMTSAVNLALKSNDEQQGTIYMFQNFLNSLDFSVQILVQSRKLDIKPYLNSLRDRGEVVEEPLLQLQIREYVNFIKNFTDQINVMKKHFFVVVSFIPSGATSKSSPFSGLFGGNKNKKIEKEAFSEHFSQLEQRIALVKSGLSRVGVRSSLLGNEEAIELFYNIFNMGDGSSSINADT